MIAKALVDNPDQVHVRAIEAEQLTVLESPERSRERDRPSRAHGRFHPHYHGCGGHETTQARHGGNPGVKIVDEKIVITRVGNPADAGRQTLSQILSALAHSDFMLT